MMLVTIDPIGTVALFVPLTAMTTAERRATARKAVFVAAIVLLAFLFAGEIVLAHLGIRLVSFQLAGGVILFLFGLQMVYGTGVAAEEGWSRHRRVSVGDARNRQPRRDHGGGVAHR